MNGLEIFLSIGKFIPSITTLEKGKTRIDLGKKTICFLLSYGKIVRKDINSSDGLLPESFNTYNIVEANDIIIRPTDLQMIKEVFVRDWFMSVA